MAMLKSGLRDYSEEYILFKGNITVNITQLQILMQIIQLKK